MTIKYSYSCVIFSSIIYVIFILLVSCENVAFQSNQYIHNAENIIEQSPEAAMQILDSIIDPTSLSKDELYRYNLLKIQSKDKLYKDITQDTVIFEICDYYINQKEYLTAAKSCYYAGRVLHEKKENDRAIHFYKEAERYADYLGSDLNLKGVIQTNIGYLLYHQFEFKEALTCFKKASEYFEQDKQLIVKDLSVKLEIGNCFSMLHENDSANYYYNLSLNLADDSQEPSIKIGALINLGSVYVNQGSYRESLKLYRQALALTPDNTTTEATLYLNIATSYNNINKKDSANYYFNKALNISTAINEPYLLATLYNISYKQNEESRNYEKAFADLKEYNSIIENIYLKNEKKEVLDIQKKYQFEQVKNLNSELQIKNQKIIVSSLVAILIMIILCFIYYYRMQKNKRKVDEAEKKILHLNNLALGYDEKRKTFRDTLLHHFDILKKSAVLQMYLRKDEIRQGERLLSKFNDIVYKQQELDWDMLYDTMNELHYGFLDRLKELASTLDDNEFKICCLIYSDFTNQEIGIIMKFSSSTITHKRSLIRKKLGLPDYSNISEYLKDLSKSL